MHPTVRGRQLAMSGGAITWARVLYLAALIALFPIAGVSQVSGVDGSQGTPIPGAGHNYIHGLQETVNPATGSVSLHIDLGGPPSRGTTVPLALTYDSAGVHYLSPNNGATIWGTNQYSEQPSFSGPPIGMGWSYSYPKLTIRDYQDTWLYNDGVSTQTYTCEYFSSYVLDSGAGRHVLSLSVVPRAGTYDCNSWANNLSDSPDFVDYFGTTTACTGCASPPPVAVSNDNGTVYYFSQFQSFGNSDGSYGFLAFPDYIKDRNGNTTTFNTAGGGIAVTDTAGRSAATISALNPSNLTNSISISGLPTPISVQWASAPYNYSTSASGCETTTSPDHGSGNVVQTITLPNQQTYQFQYDSVYGLLQRITYPTGAYIRYEWGVNPQAEYLNIPIPGSQTPCEIHFDEPAILHRYVSFDGTTEAQEQDFSYSTTFDGYPWGTKQTVVTTIDKVRNQSFRTTYLYWPTGSGSVVPNRPSTLGIPVERTITYQNADQSVAETMTKAFVNPERPLCTTTTSGASGSTSGTWLVYDVNSHVTNKKEYDYGLVSSSDCDGSPTLPGATPTRETVTSYAPAATTPVGGIINNRPSSVKVYGNGTLANETDFSYDQFPISPVSSPTQLDSNFGTVYVSPRGNLTTAIGKCISGTGCTGDSITTYTYDETGQLASMTDPCGNSTCSDIAGSNHTTTYSYQDSPSGGNSAGNSNAYLTSITKPATNGVAHSTSYKYDYASGNLTESDDENGQPTNYYYTDPFLRLKDVYGPPSAQNSNSRPHTHNDYTDGSNGAPSNVTSTSPVGVQIKTVSDGFGHATGTQINTDPLTTDFVDVTYDGEGLVYTKTNPYRSGDTKAMTTLTYDALGREILQQNPDGTTEQWQYSGPTVTVIDERGIQWQRTSDGLGRLVKVVEPSGGTTATYSYDAVNNLTEVVQASTSGSQTRRFGYDSLSRLIKTCNPERIPQGASCDGNTWGDVYSYDANGNSSSKTDANGVTVSYTYDVLNRITNETTSDGSDAEVFFYDVAPSLWGGTPFSCTNGKGRICQADHQGYSGTAINYDEMGRVTSNLYGSVTDGPPYKPGMSVVYDLAGNPTNLTYPDGRQITQTWDLAGRLSSIHDSTPGGPGTLYLSGPGPSNGVEYWPSGAESASTLGIVLSENFTLNSRLQVSHATASWLSGGSTLPLIDRQSFYTSTGSSPCGDITKNNGNLYSIVDNLQPGLTQSFSYDCLNRITSGGRNDGAYSHAYDYDSFGNMTPTDNLAHNSVAYEPDPAGTNRLLRSHDGGVTFGNGATLGDFIYDASGSLIQSADGISAPHTYQHNGFGQVISIDNGQTMTYVYNGLNERAYKIVGGTFPTDPYNWKISGGIWTNYIYLNGQPMAEKGQNGNWTDYIYANGQKIARVASTQNVIHFHGNDCSGCNYNWVATKWAPGLGYQIQNGDKFVYKQRQLGISAGLYIYTAQGGDSCCANINDQNGVGTDYFNATDGLWHDRIVDLSPFAGQTISSIGTNTQGNPPPGVWDVYYADVAILTADHTIIPIFSGQPGLGMTIWGPAGQTELSAAVEPMTSSDPAFPTAHYYLDDHLGSTQMELSGGGWPVWSGQFTPFGQEVVAGQVLSATLGNQQPGDGTTMHYKFTGKERDSESGFDYFGARYYESAVGRFSSPDPSGLSYADPANPQTLNLYSYVANRPLFAVDPDGLSWFNQAPCSGTYYAGLSVVGAVKNFFANLFANCGGASSVPDTNDMGPGVGSANSGQSTPNALTSLELDARVRAASLHMQKTRCNSVYKNVGKDLGIPFSQQAFDKALTSNVIQYPSENRYGVAYAHVPYPFTGGKGAGNQNKIELFKPFYNRSSDEQGGTLAHEETHGYFNLGDTLDQSGADSFEYFFGRYGYRNRSDGTHSFTSWLMQGCPRRF